jgi:hypothetical protein
MKLTEGLKKSIDESSYESLLSRWRFSKIGEPLFQGESGDYFQKVMLEKKELVDHVAISKKIGWEE